jgi:5-methylcytosine-specific restriction endonuclease McrA
VCYVPGCPRYANTVDHIIPVALGGTHAPSNLRPACGHHNSSTGASMGNRMRPPQPITARQWAAIGAKQRRGGQQAPKARSRAW